MTRRAGTLSFSKSNTEAVAASPGPTWPAPICTLGPRKVKTEGNDEITMPVPNVKDLDDHMRLHSDLTMLKMISKSEVSSGYPILCEGLKNDEFSENFWNDPEILWNVPNMSRVTSDDKLMSTY